MKRIAIVATALLLSACSSFKMGMACYVPHGQYGECRVGPTPAMVPAPAASAAR